MAKLTVSILAPDKNIVGHDVDMVVAPSVLGEVGILPDHRPLLAELSEGQVSLTRGTQTDRYAVAGGFLEVNANKVLLLLEAAEMKPDIDVKRAEKNLREAEEKLKALSMDDPAYGEWSGRAKRARARLQVASHA